MGTKQYQTYFHPQPLHELYGCGLATTEKLNKQGIHTIGDLAKADLSILRVLLGKRGELLHDYALGISRNTVDTMREHIDKSIGKETTFREDISDSSVVFEVAKQMSERLAARLQQKGNRIRTVSIVYKTERTGRAHTKSVTLPTPTSDAEQIYLTAIRLYQDHLYEVPIRLFGVRLANIEEISFDQLTFEDFDFT